MFNSEKSWQKIINSYEQSSLSKSDFCKENKIQVNQFYYWCNKLRPDLKSELHVKNSSTSCGSFIPIKQNNKGFTVQINGIRLEFD